MVITRLEPGARAPVGGVFALVGHWGEPTGFVCECKSGERLPDRPSESPADRMLWYVRSEQISEVRLAA